MTSRWPQGLLIVLSVALLAATAVLLLRDDEVSLTVGEPEVVTAPQLSELAADTATPIYWVGEREGVDYEVSETSSGRVYVRYLEAGAKAGDERAEFLTVGTYPSPNAVVALRRAARTLRNAELGRTDDGAVLLIDPSSPNNAHLAYPGTDLQIEIFSSEPGEALRLASRAQVQLVT